MKNPHVLAKRQQLDYLFDRARDLSDSTLIEIQSHWSRYLCVLLSGFLETTIRTLYFDYVSSRTPANISRYINKTLESQRSRNIKSSSLLELVELFNSDWKKELDEYLDENGRREALDSLATLRNNVSHGGTASVSLAITKSYYHKVVEVVEFLEKQCERG